MKDLTKLKPNELIRLAIKDMKATINQGHTIDMGDWGKNIGHSNCSVCFAGSIMLQEGKEPNCFDSFDINYDVNQKVYQALDYIRKGSLQNFCTKLDVENPTIKKIGLPIDEFDVRYNRGNEEEFYTYMENIAKLFD